MNDQEMRIMAHVNGNMVANCEDCGKPIPVELSKCDDCSDPGYVTCGEELVPESHGPFGDYYVTRSQATRHAEIIAALEALSC